MPKNFFEELKWRGLIQDSTPGVDEELEKKSLSAYIGFDPTSDSLHIGSLVQLLILKHFQEVILPVDIFCGKSFLLVTSKKYQVLSIKE